MSRKSPAVALALFAAGLFAGCSDKPSPPTTPPVPPSPTPAPDTPKADKPPAFASRGAEGGYVPPPPTAPDEDPEFTQFLQKKGWRHVTESRTPGKPPMKYLFPPKGGLMLGDFKVIAKSKTTQVLGLRDSDIDDADLKAIAGMPQVVELWLADGTYSDDGIRALAAMPNLKVIEFWGGGGKMTGTGFDAFAGSKTLERLDLQYCDKLSDEGAKAIARIPTLQSLKITNNAANKGFTVAGLKAIAGLRIPPDFQFDTTLLDDELFTKLVQGGWLYGPTAPTATAKKPATAAAVTVLTLNPRMTDAGAKAAADCVNVETLYADGAAGIGDATLKLFAPAKKLKVLELSRTKVTADGLEAVSGCPVQELRMWGAPLNAASSAAVGKMTDLRKLDLSHAEGIADWAKLLAGLKNLTSFTVETTGFDDAAAKTLATLTTLQSVNLKFTKLTDAGFAEVLKLPNLKELSVDGSRVTKEAFQKARQENPKVKLHTYQFSEK